MSVSQHPRWSSIRQIVADAVLAAAGIACLANGVLSLWTGNLPSSGMGLAAGLVLLLAASVERFEVLKGLGVEARTRKLDEAINQANATVEQLRELAEMSGAALVSLNSKAGRWSEAPSIRESYATAQRVRKHLESLGSSSETMRDVLAPWVKVTTVDVVRELLKHVQRPLVLAQEHLNQRLQSYPTPIRSDDPAYQALLNDRNRYGAFIGNYVGEVNDWPPGTHAERLRAVVREMPLLDEADRLRLKEHIAPWLKRIDHLARHNDLVDQEEWFATLRREADILG
jgi:hypothetical protein